MKRISIVLMALMLMVTMVPVITADQHAEPAIEVNVVMEIGETNYTLNGSQRTMDAVPI